MTRPIVLALLVLCSGASALAQQGGNMPASTAPAEARQFDFLLGQWELEVTPKASGLAARLHGVPKLHGTWKAWRAFDGFGIEDELRIIDGSGNPVSLSHALRVRSAVAKRWSIMSLDVYRARYSSATAQPDGADMVLAGQGTDIEGKPYRSRTRFSEITADGFRMQQDRSSDDGKSWDEATLTVVATRVAASATR
jgi:hypothetical protein